MVILMNLQQTTVGKIEQLREKAGLWNNADAVRFAVELALMLADAMGSGGEIVVVTADGSMKKLVTHRMKGQ